MKSKQFINLILVFFLLVICSPIASQSLESIAKKQEGISMRSGSGNPFNNDDNIALGIGETKTIAVLDGPGLIVHMWFAPSSMNIRWPRALVLRIYWDGSDIPSVETPFGDFFAVGNGMMAIVNSLPVTVSSYGRGLNCYWQMPFGGKAKITLSNESDTEIAGSYFMIDWIKLPKVPTNLMYFHARYHQEYPPILGKPYTVFKTEGNGHYVGTVLSSHNATGFWFGEGDDYFYVDGEKKPSISGTGTEDYFNEAWNMRVHSSLYTGCTVFEPRGIDARITAYRWHIPDPIIFTKSLKFEIERTGFLMDDNGVNITASGSRPDNWSSVSFWYQNTIAKPWCEFPVYKDRVDPEIVLHLPQIINYIKHSSKVQLVVNPYNRATYTKPWFQVLNSSLGSWIEIPFEIKEAGRYSMSLFQLLRRDNGIWKVYIDDKEVYEAGESQIADGYEIDRVNQLPKESINTTLDFYNTYEIDEHEDYIYGQRRERKIGLFEFNPGRHTLKLLCVGANPLSTNPETGNLRYNLTADVLSLRKLNFVDYHGWLNEVIKRGGLEKDK
jgi:hypothetical protein